MSFYRNALSRTSGITVSTTASNPIMIRNNTIRDIYSNSTGTTTSSFRPVGIAVTSAPATGLTITQNTIRNIQHTNTGTAAYVVSGMMINAGTGSTYTITQNRIRNVGAVGVGAGTAAPVVHGINIGTAANALVANNQIAIGDSAFNESIVYGISDFSAGNNTYAYNSIFVNGVNAAGSNLSSGFFRNTTTSTINFRNNIVYNKRVSLASANNYAVTSASATGVSSATLNYNLFIVNDTARIAVLPTGTVNGWSALNTLYGTTYNTNWAEHTTNITAQALFVDTASGNLAINTANPEAWYANGKGIRISTISGDFDNASGVRSTSITNGATDIGSVEFTPTSTPPAAFADKLPASNDSTQFFFASRLIGKTVWNAIGSVPTSVSLRYYSGVNPSNTPVSTTFANAYYDLQQSGGSGFTYTLTLMQDSNVMSNISAANNIDIANYRGTGTNWFRYVNTDVNNITGFASAITVANTGIFTFTDSAVNPLPVKLINFTAVAQGVNGKINWTTASEINHESFTLLRSFDGESFEPIHRVVGDGNSSSVKQYEYLDNQVLVKTNTVYYQLLQTDNDGKQTYSQVVKLNTTQKTPTLVTVYPNPFVLNTYLNVTTENSGDLEISITDVSGKIVSQFTQTIKVGLTTIELPGVANLPSGIYFIKLSGAENTTLKLLKTQN